MINKWVTRFNGGAGATDFKNSTKEVAIIVGALLRCQTSFSIFFFTIFFIFTLSDPHITLHDILSLTSNANQKLFFKSNEVF